MMPAAAAGAESAGGAQTISALRSDRPLIRGGIARAGAVAERLDSQIKAGRTDATRRLA